MDYFTTIKYILIFLKVTFAIVQITIYQFVRSTSLFLEKFKMEYLRQIKIDYFSLFAIGMLLPFGSNVQSVYAKGSLRGMTKVVQYDDRLNLNTSVEYGVGVSYQIDRNWILSAEGYAGNAHQIFDTISGTEKSTVSIRNLMLKLQYTAMQVKGWFNLGLDASVGLIRLYTPMRQVDLGALGNVSIAARREIYSDLGVGAVMNRNLGNRITAFISPRAHFFSASGTKRSLQVTGGLNIAVFN